MGLSSYFNITVHTYSMPTIEFCKPQHKMESHRRCFIFLGGEYSILTLRYSETLDNLNQVVKYV